MDTIKPPRSSKWREQPFSPLLTFRVTEGLSHSRYSRYSRSESSEKRYRRSLAKREADPLRATKGLAKRASPSVMRARGEESQARSSLLVPFASRWSPSVSRIARSGREFTKSVTLQERRETKDDTGKEPTRRSFLSDGDDSCQKK